MDHTPLHWGYSAPNNQGTWTPPSSKSSKRALSESDCDDVYSEDSKEQ